MSASGYAKNSRTFTGRFVVKNTSKYVGDVQNVIYRSSYELRFMKWCDQTPSVLEWGSEEVIVPYINPWDQRAHRYFVDFYIKVRDKTNHVKKYLIEVKPLKFTQPPKAGKRKTRQFYAEVKDFGVNQAKWKAATEFAKGADCEFLVITEADLGLNVRKSHK